MGKELELKAPKAKTRKLGLVKFTEDVVFFGYNGRQLSFMMEGIHLDYDDERGVVVVKNDNYPGRERWVFPAAISSLEWIDD